VPRGPEPWREDTDSRGTAVAVLPGRLRPSSGQERSRESVVRSSGLPGRGNAWTGSFTFAVPRETGSLRLRDRLMLRRLSARYMGCGIGHRPGSAGIGMMAGAGCRGLIGHRDGMASPGVAPEPIWRWVRRRPWTQCRLCEGSVTFRYPDESVAQLRM